MNEPTLTDTEREFFEKIEDSGQTQGLTAHIAALVAKAHRAGHREGYETARYDLTSGAFIGGPTYEALRDSHTGQHIVVEAVDRERAAWATKIKTALDLSCHHCGRMPEADGDHTCLCPNAECFDHLADPVVSRGAVCALLAADDTEEIHPSVQWVADAIAAAVSADDTEGKP